MNSLYNVLSLSNLNYTFRIIYQIAESKNSSNDKASHVNVISVLRLKQSNMITLSV
jgi:hypothetical protein